jgi:hypothetical protein
MVNESTNDRDDHGDLNHDGLGGTTPVTPVQPRWMTITVALTGIIGLVVMILLVRG